jgi:hypothetical protein
LRGPVSVTVRVEDIHAVFRNWGAPSCFNMFFGLAMGQIRNT